MKDLHLQSLLHAAVMDDRSYSASVVIIEVVTTGRDRVTMCSGLECTTMLQHADARQTADRQHTIKQSWSTCLEHHRARASEVTKIVAKMVLAIMGSVTMNRHTGPDSCVMACTPDRARQGSR